MDAEEMARELHDPGVGATAFGGLDPAGIHRPGRLPRVIPIGFYWDGEHIIVCTAPISPKVAALTARSQVALTRHGHVAEQGPADPRRGLVETVDGVPASTSASPEAMDRQTPDFEANVRSMYKQMSRIAITPQWARFYDFGTGRVPAFLLKLSTNPSGQATEHLAGPTRPGEGMRPGLVSAGTAVNLVGLVEGRLRVAPRGRCRSR